jgi:hypothetical protein
MIPFLTGLFLNETQKLYSLNDNFADNFPYLWYEFEKNGYITSFQIDIPNWDFITMEGLPGFRQKPTGFYPRPFWIKYRELRTHSK